MSRRIELPRHFALDEDYWLSRCDGFRVEAGERRLGIVSELRFDARLDRPAELVVCGGLFGNRVVVVPTNDVLAVVPREQRVVLRDARVPERRTARALARYAAAARRCVDAADRFAGAAGLHT